jgi:hypothetical protein
MGVFVVLVCGDEELGSVELPIPPTDGMVIEFGGREYRVWEVELRPVGGGEYGVWAEVSKIA